MAEKPKTITEYADDLSLKLEGFFVGNLPALPENAKEVIVKVSPYIALVLSIMLLPIILGALGLGALFMPLSFLGGVRGGFGYIVAMVFAVGSLVLQLMAMPGLFKREKRSWKLIYYATLLSLIDDILTFRIGGLIVSTAISFYFLFQVKSKYTK